MVCCLVKSVLFVLLHLFFIAARSYDSPRGSYSGDHGHRSSYSDRSKNYNTESMDWQKAAEAWARSKSRDGKEKVCL